MEDNTKEVQEDIQEVVRKGESAKGSKPWYKSQTLLGILMAIPAIVKILLDATGYGAFSPVVDQVVTVISAIAGSLGLRLAWTGRVKATQRIEGLSK